MQGSFDCLNLTQLEHHREFCWVITFWSNSLNKFARCRPPKRLVSLSVSWIVLTWKLFRIVYWCCKKLCTQVFVKSNPRQLGRSKVLGRSSFPIWFSCFSRRIFVIETRRIFVIETKTKVSWYRLLTSFYLVTNMFLYW